MASAALGFVYLIPSNLDQENFQVIPAYVLDAIKDCQAFFVENERSARRFMKQLWKEMIIENYEWQSIHKAEGESREVFKRLLQRGMHIGILSEAGCPGIADPGQLLVSTAHEMGAVVKPLVGPSSILLALMGSGMNGQQFRFNGYLPIDHMQRIKAIKQLEEISIKHKCTQLFIETPYRNNQLLETIINSCLPSTRLCIAVNITGKQENIQTKTIGEWKKNLPDIHKLPTIFLIDASG